MCDPDALLRALVSSRGAEGALLHAAWRGREDYVLQLLQLQPPQAAPAADCRGGQALVEAAGGGHEAVVRLLLTWPHSAPAADCQNGQVCCQ